MIKFARYFIVIMMMVAVFVSCSNKNNKGETTETSNDLQATETIGTTEVTEPTNVGTSESTTSTSDVTTIDGTVTSETTTKNTETSTTSQTTTSNLPASTSVPSKNLTFNDPVEDVLDKETLFDFENPRYEWYPTEPLAEKYVSTYIEIENQDSNESFIGIAVYITKDPSDYPYRTQTKIDAMSEKLENGEEIYKFEGYEVLYIENDRSVDVSNRMVMASKYNIDTGTMKTEAYYINKDAEDLYYFIDPIMTDDYGRVHVISTNKFYKGSDISNASIGIAGKKHMSDGTVKHISCIKVRTMDNNILPDFFEADEMYEKTNYTELGMGYAFFNDTDMSDVEITIQDFCDFTLEFACNAELELLFIYENYDKDDIRRPVIDYENGYCYNDYHPYIHYRNILENQ